MRRIIAFLLTCSLLFSLCAIPVSAAEETADDLNFTGLDDPALLTYVEDSVYADLEYGLHSDDYVIENVQAVYISNEYLEELSYNSQANIFFGFTLAELEEQFQGTRYVFTLDEDGTTGVTAFEDYDDTFDRVIKNVAIGTGVILICVTVSVVTAGAGAPAVSMIFAASAKTGATFALSSATFGGVASGVITGLETKDFDAALKAAALSGSEGFKWGAITGAVVGGVNEAATLRRAADVSELTFTGDSPPTPWQSESEALSRYGGTEQVTYLGGQEVPYGTPGATRPDVVRMIDGRLEAIEVKNYNLANSSNRSELYSELERQISQRATDLPSGSLQRVVLDVRGRGFSSEQINDVVTTIQARCSSVYPNLPVDIME